MHRNSEIKHVFRVGLSVFATLALSSSNAQAAQARLAAKINDGRLVSNFQLLAQQRPWPCTDAAADVPAGPWTSTKAECAWQNRLTKRTWSWSDASPAGCVSPQARWWSWMHRDLPRRASGMPWQSSWSEQSAQLAAGGAQRILLVERGRNGRWLAIEWRWNPSPRAATRHWQEGRWKLLAELAAQHRQPSQVGAGGDGQRLQATFAAVLGRRPGEVAPEGMRLESEGLCLHLANPMAGQPKLPLSYRPDDSRLEQRTAMHLLLSRQYPQATWLTPFRMIAMPAEVPSGAKFLASWVEAGQLKGQLWMPSKTGTPTVRIRMTTPLPRGRSTQPEAAHLIRAKEIVERELQAIAVQWAVSYE